MNRINHLILVITLVVLSACQQRPENVQKVAHLPKIFPDYVDVTFPVGIAPLNFELLDEDVELVDITVKGSKGGELHEQGCYADFDIDDWQALTKANQGGDLTFTVCAKKAGQWLQYQDFQMHVSRYPLEDYGLTYRRIAPGYEVGGDMGLYQRDLHSFKEYAILEEQMVPGRCMNCHTANQGSGDQFLFHVRGEKSGTMVQSDGQLTWLNTMTDSTKANFGYSYWHPSGRYIVSSTNKIYQLFYTGLGGADMHRIEVFDGMSDVVVLDTRTQQLILHPMLQQKDWLETYPVFSADGKSIYFCAAKARKLPDEYDQIRYSLCRIPFDAERGVLGNKVDTLLHAERDSLSYTFPRPSFDGRWLMYNVCSFGNFPTNHPESELCLMDLHTGRTRLLNEVNSSDAESYHGWSSNSRWFVFASRRGDGMYNKLYLSSVDDEGKATKPFLLPQRHPKKFYMELLDSYNCPDFTRERIELDVRRVSDVIMHSDRVQVGVR